MNIYGDVGNIICLQKRAEWRGIEVKVVNLSIGTKIKKGTADLYFFGGGQDQGQISVGKDLIGKAEIIKSEIDRGVPLLAICGGYQLLGEYYQPLQGPKIEGIGLFSASTKASDTRMIGNILIESKFGNLVGFENHSGQTMLNKSAKPLGKVKRGFGNNGQDSTEGCVYKNALGCYMHGSLLPKNPALADWLIEQALEVKYGEKVELKALNDNFEKQAHEAVIEFIS